MDHDPAVQTLLDRHRIVETLYRYASSIDGHDFAALRDVFADDATARYGDRHWMTGADEIVEWISGYALLQAWQHHLLSVYHVDIDGDEARALTYHTCHQASLADPGSITMLNTWLPFNLQAVAPPNTAKVDVFLGWDGGGTAPTQPQSVFFDDVVLDGPGVPPTGSSWIVDGSGDWTQGGNWANGLPPILPGSEADFLGAITSSQTVYTNQPVFTGTIVFNNANTYVLTGAGSLNMDATGLRSTT